MKQLFPRGKRIRPTDKDLVFHTALAALFPDRKRTRLNSSHKVQSRMPSSG